MSTDEQKQLELANSRAKRLKAARDEAERLLEQKSRELYAANQELEAIQRGLEDNIALATQELSVSNERLHAALEERSAFIGQMSHEVRTPLNAIVGLSELLLTTELESTQLDHVDTMNSAARALIVLLNDMLDITKIEAGKLELHIEHAELERIHQNILSMFKIEADAKGLEFELRFDPDVPKYVRLDKGRYKQIVNNLVTNAVKNTEQGIIKIYVSFRLNEVSPEIGMLSVQVIDTGVGIPEDQLENIFKAYEQLGSTGKGVGLGLAICSQLCELMQGRISCDSIVGEGSIFEFSLPVEAVDERDIELSSQQSDRSLASTQLSILVAEDNPTNQKVLNAQLTQLGQSADMVNNGAEALVQLEKRSYDLVLLDILMPVMDGEQALKAIRDSDDRVSSHYCVALTASSYQDQRNRLLKLGFDDFLSKPLGLAELARALEKVPINDGVERTDTALAVDVKTAELPSIPRLDVSYFKSQFGDAWEAVFIEIVPTFLEHTNSNLEELKEALVEVHIERIRKISHSCKGAAASVGQADFAECLAKLERKPGSPKVAEWFSEIENQWADISFKFQRELDRLAQD